MWVINFINVGQKFVLFCFVCNQIVGAFLFINIAVGVAWSVCCTQYTEVIVLAA
jgi:hypothetical protein